MPFRAALVALLLFLAVPIASAQITSVTEDQAPPQPGVGHDYIKMLNETVNPATGSVSVRIGTPVPSGRDLTVPFSFGYDSNSAHHIVVNAITNVSLAWADNESYLAFGGWSYGIPVLEFAYQQKRWVQSGSPPQTWACEYFTDYTMTGLDGRSHALYVSETQPTGGSCQYAPAPTPPNPQNYLSGSDGLVQANMPAMTNGLPTAVSVVGADGMVYYFPNTTTHLASVQTFESSLPAWIETRNGNKAVFSDLGSGALRITDTLGRTAISTSGFGVNGNTVAVAGLSNPYTVSWGSSNSSYTVNASVTNYFGDGHTCASFPTSLGSTQSHITQVTLPNSTSYQFQYDLNTGLVSRIIYPTGGYVRYVWGTNPSSESMLYPESLSTGPGTGDGCQAIYDTLAVAKRYVSFDGTHEVLEQDFTYSTTWNSSAPKQWTSKTTTVTTKDLARPNTSFETQYTYIPVPAGTQPNDQVVYGESGYPVERQIVYFNDLGVTQLETVTKGWPQNFIDGTGQNFLLCELHSPSSSQIAGAFFSYGSLGVVTDKKEYDYGAISSATSACQDSSIVSPPNGQARETVVNYQSFADTPIYPSGPSLFDRPSSIVIKDGSGNRVAETDYAYDQNAVPGASTPSGTHDETNYSANSSAPRGNATTITKQCFPSCSNAVSTYTYDEAGQMLSRTDPCGNASCSDVSGTNHTSTYSYADSYNSCSGNAPPSGATDAYLTQINYPATNGVSHVVNFCYGYDDGQLRGSTDQNNQMTLYKYNDLLGRLTESDYPVGQTLISYSDAPLSPTVTTEKLISSGVYLTTVDTLDGMGHQIESQLTSDPQGTITQYKTLDGLGHDYQVYNPYRSTSDPTYGFTTYAYDALGRTTTVTRQDGSVASTTYSGNW